MWDREAVGHFDGVFVNSTWKKSKWNHFYAIIVHIHQYINISREQTFINSISLWGRGEGASIITFVKDVVYYVIFSFRATFIYFLNADTKYIYYNDIWAHSNR